MMKITLTEVITYSDEENVSMSKRTSFETYQDWRKQPYEQNTIKIIQTSQAQTL